MSKILAGLLAMCVVFGWQFVATVLLLLGLTAWSVLNLHGGLSVVLLLVLALVLYRAHDFVGEEIRIHDRTHDAEPSEHTAAYDALAPLRTPYAPPSVVLGPTHRGHDL